MKSIDNQLSSLLNAVKLELKKENIYKNELTESVSYTIDSKGEAYNKRALLLLGFFLYVRYFSKIQLSSYNSYEDIKLDIAKSEHPKKQQILKLFSDLEGFCKESINSPSAILESVDKYFNPSIVINREEEFTTWCISNLFFDTGNDWYFHEDAFGEYYNILKEVALSALKLPNFFEKEDASILVTIDNHKDLAQLFMSPQKAKITLYGCSHAELDIRINILLNPTFSNYQFVNYPIEHESKLKRGEACEIKGKDQVFCFDSKDGFDLIISSCLLYNDLKLDDILYFLKPNGFTIAMGINPKKANITESFYQYQIPFVLNYYTWDEQMALICVKKNDTDGLVYVADIEFHEIYGISMGAKEVAGMIKENASNSYIQLLNKLDFKYCEKDSVAFYNIQRDIDKLGYVWKEKSRLLLPHLSYECIHEDIALDKIVATSTLSNFSEFNFRLPDSYHQIAPKCGYLGKNSYIEEFGIDDLSGKIEGIPYDYFQEMRPILKIKGELTDSIRQFEAKVCCRYVISPAWLYNREKHKIVHVDASFDRPICYRALSFHSDEYQQWFTIQELTPVLIDSNYDEDYIAHVINTTKKEAVLIPPTKEEQHKAYLRSLDNEHKRIQQGLEADRQRLGISELHSDFNHMLGAPLDFFNTIIQSLKDYNTNDPFITKYINYLYEISTHINSVINYNGKDFSQIEINPKKTDIIPYLQSYCEMWKIYYSECFNLSFNDGGINSCFVSVDSRILKFALDVLHSNVYRHGFKKRRNINNRNQMEFSLATVNYYGTPYLSISAKNNGDPMPTKFTIEDFVTRGRFSLDSGHTGLGGNHLYEIVKKHKGYLRINSNSKEWPVVFEILLPIDNSEKFELIDYDNNLFI